MLTLQSIVIKGGKMLFENIGEKSDLKTLETKSDSKIQENILFENMGKNLI